MKHSFTAIILNILERYFPDIGESIYNKSDLLQYINIKTKSANHGSKARGSFANLYAIYVIVEDYLTKNFSKKSGYEKYEGAEFTKLFQRQRKLPFGTKLQNHALNNRMNSEFQKYFSNNNYVPILRNFETNRYWINENLLKMTINDNVYNIANVVIKIIDEYIKTKKYAFEKFIKSCMEIQNIKDKSLHEAEKFILSLIAQNVDARLFEIASYAILKHYYHNQKIYWGFESDNLNEENLKLFKTGRTNANDGGIDFVMKPLGRFFQVTETLNIQKYFLDIDKVQRFPITFVIKTKENINQIRKTLQENAKKRYVVKPIIEKYMQCIEEIINIPILQKRFKEVIRRGGLGNVLNEIIVQSEVEFNYTNHSTNEMVRLSR